MLSQGIRVEQIISRLISQLQDYFSNPRGELEYMIMALKSLRARSSLYTSSLILTPEEMSKLENMIACRKKGIPLQYITGNINFYGLEFKIHPGVFIPRPETEIVVDYIIQIYKNYRRLRILEIGTGSGVISICLTKFLPESKIIATDISASALKLAEENARLHKVEISFVRGNLFDFLSPREKFDLIVSNPPYVGRKEYDFLPPEVKAEPKDALIGGELGYEFTLGMIVEGCNYLEKEGKIILEIDYRAENVYTEKLSEMFNLEFIPDFNSRNRVMVVSR